MLESLSVPIVCLDTETTGVHVEVDRIVQIGVVKINPNGSRRKWQSLVNPEIPIPPEATEVHGITDDMVAKAPTFQQLCDRERIHLGFRGCDVLGYNASFDLDFLRSEFNRLDFEDPFKSSRIIDPLSIYRFFSPRDLTAAVKEYLGEEMVGAHDAMTDIEYTIRVFEAQLQRHPELPSQISELHKQFFQKTDPRNVDIDGKFYWRYREATFNFGKYSGISLRSIAKEDPGYLRWMVKGEFSEEVKLIVFNAQNGKFPVKE